MLDANLSADQSRLEYVANLPGGLNLVNGFGAGAGAALCGSDHDHPSGYAAW
jgi:hypothetical protein